MRRSIRPIGAMATLAVVTGGLLALIFGSGAVTLVRDRLHILCFAGQPGTEADGSWVCPDGISYLGVAAVLGIVPLFIVIAGALVALFGNGSRATRAWLTALATVPLIWALLWTWIGARDFIRELPPNTSASDIWVAVMLPTAIVAGLALSVAAGALVIEGRVAWLVTLGSAGGLLIATVLQPGIGFSTLPSSGLLVAAAIHAHRPPGRIAHGS